MSITLWLLNLFSHTKENTQALFTVAYGTLTQERDIPKPLKA